MLIPFSNISLIDANRICPNGPYPVLTSKLTQSTMQASRDPVIFTVADDPLIEYRITPAVRKSLITGAMRKLYSSYMAGDYVVRSDVRRLDINKSDCVLSNKLLILENVHHQG